MRVVTVVGARPQFIKASAVSRVLRDEYAGRIEEVLVHTGQHFDENMSKVFFDELDIPLPKHQLGISGGGHGEMTGRMLGALEGVLREEKPDWVLVFGDTNSTLAAALAAVKMHLPVAHVEAGLRSFNMRMPEEVNRILSDRVSSLLFCPTETAVRNLKAEGIVSGVHQVGDVMYDVALFYREQAREKSDALERLGLEPGGFALATCHRAENTDSPDRLREICLGLSGLAEKLPVVLPLHPRTRKVLEEIGCEAMLGKVRIISPLSFFDMIALEQSARLMMTDSGGIQKEAFFYGVPCVTLRDETEWIETVELGWNELAGASGERILAAADRVLSGKRGISAAPYGDGRAAASIALKLIEV